LLHTLHIQHNFARTPGNQVLYDAREGVYARTEYDATLNVEDRGAAAISNLWLLDNSAAVRRQRAARHSVRWLPSLTPTRNTAKCNFMCSSV
jgi:hypothetical protein